MSPLIQPVGFGRSTGGGGGGGKASHVKTTVAQSGGTTSFTHNLAATGNNRLVVAIEAGSSGARETLNSATFGGVSASGILESDIGADGGRAASFAIAYWLDANHPGVGDQTLSLTWGAAPNDNRSVVMEFQDAAQTNTFGDRDTATAINTIFNNISLSVSITGENGELGVVAITVNDVDDADGTETLAASNTENERAEEKDEFFRTILGVWTDDTVDGSPVSYNITGSGSTSTDDSIAAVAFSIRGA